MASLYVDPDLGASAPEVGRTVDLRGPEARHAATVSRVRPGETLSITDGKGLVISGAVLSARPEVVSVEVRAIRHDPAPTVELWLAQALAKGDRDELAIQAATELGVAGVIPWNAERSVTRWTGPKIEKSLLRWRAIVTEASKQSLRSRIPVVDDLSATERLATLVTAFQVVVLDPDAVTRLTELPLDLTGTPEAPSRVLLLVGPEGGIASGELDRLHAAGARSARLGSEVLRTSTAGPAAIAVLNARTGAW